MQLKLTFTTLCSVWLSIFAAADQAGATEQPLPTRPVPAAEPAIDYPIRPVPFTAVRITDGFWKTKQDINREVTVPFALQQCEKSGRLKNFDLAAEVMRRRAAGEKGFQINPPTQFPFDDTDVYKSIEAAAYVLSMGPDPALEEKMDEWIKHVAAAQESDGYLYTFRTMQPRHSQAELVGERAVGRRSEKQP